MEIETENTPEQNFTTPINRNYKKLLSSSPKGGNLNEGIGEINLEVIATLTEVSQQEENYPSDGEVFMETSQDNVKTTSKKARGASKDSDSDL